MLSIKNTVFSLVSVLFFLCFSISINAQNEIKPDARLFVKYNNDYVNNLIANSPEIISYLNYTLDNSCYFLTDDNEKFKNSPQLRLFDNATKTVVANPVSEIDKGNFIILLYDIQLSYNQRTSYRIGNSNQVVVFYSSKEMANRFNKFKQSGK